MGLFGKLDKKPDPSVLAKEWTRELRSQERVVQRQIRSIEMEKQKVKRSCKELARKGQIGAVRTLAREIVVADKNIRRMYEARARLNSIRMELQHMNSLARVSGSLRMSADVMRQVSSLCNLPELSTSMQELSQQMLKNAVIEDVMEEAFEDMAGEDEEEESEAALQAIIDEVTGQQLAGTSTARTRKLSSSVPASSSQAASSIPQEDSRVLLGADGGASSSRAAGAAPPPPSSGDAALQSSLDSQLNSLSERLARLNS